MREADNNVAELDSSKYFLPVFKTVSAQPEYVAKVTHLHVWFLGPCIPIQGLITYASKIRTVKIVQLEKQLLI